MYSTVKTSVDPDDPTQLNIDIYVKPVCPVKYIDMSFILQSENFKVFDTTPDIVDGIKWFAIRIYHRTVTDWLVETFIENEDYRDLTADEDELVWVDVTEKTLMFMQLKWS